MILETLPLTVKGHVLITDDQGMVLLDKDNAVHPQNMARIISRTLANENNDFIHRIAFGNGGTTVLVSQEIDYKLPNDGINDVAGFSSVLWNETYSEIIDDSNVSIGVDPITGGDDVASDPASIEHVSGPGVRSNELGLTSEVVITSVLNPGEPLGQLLTDGTGTPQEDPESDFMFDEIGLFTGGLPGSATNAYQDVDVGNKISTDDAGISANTYDFNVDVDGGGPVNYSIIVPASGTGAGGVVTYGDIVELILAAVGFPIANVSVAITDYSGGTYPSITGAQTYGFLRFTRTTPGSATSVVITAGTTLDLFGALNTGAGIIDAAVAGQDVGLQNDPVNSIAERERMLTHIIFSPVLKSANRTLTITYTLTVSVAQTV